MSIGKGKLVDFSDITQSLAGMTKHERIVRPFVLLYKNTFTMTKSHDIPKGKRKLYCLKDNTSLMDWSISKTFETVLAGLSSN